MQELVQQIVNGLVLGSTYALIALGLTMIYGILGIVNWAHGELYMLGAFIGFYLVVSLKLPFIIGLMGAMGIMALFGLMMERLVFRPLRDAHEMNMIIGTLGISIFLMNAAIVIFSPNPLRFPTEFSNTYLSFLGISITLQRLLVFFITIGLIIVFNYIIQKTTIGKAMRACEQNQDAAKLMGININNISLITCAIGAALAAAAGTLVGPIFLVSPQMGLAVISKVFAVVILGGLGNVAGAIWAAFTLGLAESLAAGFLSSYYKDVIAFIILIIVLVFRPQGLFSSHSVEKV
ncbi:branched-chain amino acid ABC transporter permease [Sporolituus thermophilus]|uniref:Branched-chain amino acid transport system permease protein n=1 Tax=Sporolituus thermophilus DSM 23256 TaxID=1123285 RepID=A0A1G7M362_9FIRM|nr:branched-chain amino acid ABC transporter permease [Sporolituus thermophilus]SDF56081.1 branched-chain amino acid transport system permease protein [Sporolituus thermophilus DSM 23256]